MSLVTAPNGHRDVKTSEGLVEPHFLGRIPKHVFQIALSFLTQADTDQLGGVDKSMMGLLHADGLSTAIFLDQLKQRQQRGIPMTYAEHQRCIKIIQDEQIKQYNLRGRNAFRTRLPVEERIASIVRHLDCSDGSVGDYELHRIAARYPKLESLNLGGGFSEGITDKGCAFIAKLSQLKSLNLSYLSSITHLGLAHLNHLPLQSLSLFGCHVQDDGLRALSNLSNTLTYLDLTGSSNVTYAGLSAIMGTSLTSLNLTRCQVSDEMAAFLATFPMQELNFNGATISDRGLGMLKDLATLTHLNLASCETLTPAGHARFFNEAICPLQYLVLECPTEVDWVGALERFPELTHLILSTRFLTDHKLTFLSRLPLLTHLDISGNSDLTPAVLDSIQHLPLRSLYLEGCHEILTNVGMQALALFPILEELDLSYSMGITKEGFAALTNLPLRSLNLYQSIIGDEDIQIIAETLPLKCLDLRRHGGCRDRLPTDASAQALSLLPLEHLIISPETFSESSQRLLKRIIPYVEASNYAVLSRPKVTPFDRPFPIHHPT